MGVIEECGARLAELDAGGTALVVIRSDSAADIRAVVATYVHQYHQLRAAQVPGPREVRKPASRLVMKELTSFGVMKFQGFYGAFDARKDVPGDGPTPSLSAGDDLLDVLARAADSDDAYDARPLLLFIPDPAYLGADEDARNFDDRARQAIYLLRQIAADKRTGRNRVLVVMGAKPGARVPPLEADAYLLDMGYPQDAEIREFLCELYEQNCEGPVVPLAPFVLTRLVALFRGFGRDQIRSTILLAFARHPAPFDNEALDLVADIAEAKLQLLKKADGLSLRDPHHDTPGGLGELHRWVRAKEPLLTYADAARAHGVDLPQGILASGVPGTGKSYAAEWVAQTFHLPFFQLDMGAIMGRYLGESESRFNRALTLLEAMAPCVLFIDELDKSFSGAGSGGSEGGASLDRVFGRFLGWLQDAPRRRAPVFVFATANNIERLPSEFLRLGRFDEKFFFFLPTWEECAQVFLVHLRKHRDMIAWPVDAGGAAGRSEDAGRAFDDALREHVIAPVMRAATEAGKLMTAADIAAVVKEAFQQLFCAGILCLDVRARQDAASRPDERMRASLGEVAHALREKLLDTRVYGDTNMREVARYWRWAAETRPRSVSGEQPVLAYEDFDRRRARFSSIAAASLDGLDALSDDEYRERLSQTLDAVRTGRARSVSNRYNAVQALLVAQELFEGAHMRTTPR